MSRGFQPVYTPVRRSGPPGWLLGLIGLGLVFVIGVARLRPAVGQPPSPSPSPTPSAVAATDAPSPPPTSAPTDAPRSSEPTMDASPTPPASGPATPAPTIDPQLAAQIDAVIGPGAARPCGCEPTSAVPYEFVSRDQFRRRPDRARRRGRAGRGSRRRGAAAQAPWAAARRRRPRGAAARPVRRPGRRVLPARQRALLHHRARSTVRGDRQDRCRPRVHPRAAGPGTSTWREPASPTQRRAMPPLAQLAVIEGDATLTIAALGAPEPDPG